MSRRRFLKIAEDPGESRILPGRDGRRTLGWSRSTINRETAAIISRQFN